MSNVMALQGVSSTGSLNSTNSSITDATSSIMDKDDFLKLFLASLQYQDPTSPMETQDMMSQMAQLSLMEQVQNMTRAVNDLVETTQQSAIQRGMDFVGKYIVGVADDAEVVSGRVDSVRLARDGSIILVVDGKHVYSQLVTEVADSEEALSLGNTADTNEV